MTEQISNLLNPTGNFYLYFFPIISSIISGIIFWLIFSYFPERKRKNSFGLGIFNDLQTLNSHLFHYFDFLMRHQKNSPSFFQDKIHGATLTYDDLKLGLKNKVLSSDYLYDEEFAGSFLIVGEELIKKVTEIDIVINRLYSFNYFLSTKEVAIIRSIHSNLHRYMPYVESSLQKDEYFPVDPTISYLAHSAKDLLVDFKNLRNVLFDQKLKDRDFLLLKILRAINSGDYKSCIRLCKVGMKNFKSDSSTYELRTIQCFLYLKNTKTAHKLLANYNLSAKNLVGLRNLLEPIMRDPVAERIILEKADIESLKKMKAILKKEHDQKTRFLELTQLLNERYSSKNHLN